MRSPRRMAGSHSSCCSLVPCKKSACATIDSPVLCAWTGAPAFAISVMKAICSVALRPWPPNSFGQPTPIQPSRPISFENSTSQPRSLNGLRRCCARRSGVQCLASHARTSLRKAFAAGPMSCAGSDDISAIEPDRAGSRQARRVRAARRRSGRDRHARAGNVAAPRAPRHSRWRPAPGASRSTPCATPDPRMREQTEANTRQSGLSLSRASAAVSSASRAPSRLIRQLASLCCTAWN